MHFVTDLVQRKSERWSRLNETISVFFSPKALKGDQASSSPNLQPQMKDQGGSERVTEVASS